MQTDPGTRLFITYDEEGSLLSYYRSSQFKKCVSVFVCNVIYSFLHSFLPLSCPPISQLISYFLSYYSPLVLYTTSFFLASLLPILLSQPLTNFWTDGHILKSTQTAQVQLVLDVNADMKLCELEREVDLGRVGGRDVHIKISYRKFSRNLLNKRKLCFLIGKKYKECLERKWFL